MRVRNLKLDVMKKVLILTLLITFCGLVCAKSKKTDDVKVTVTFLVMMDRDTNAKISKAL